MVDVLTNNYMLNVGVVGFVAPDNHFTQYECEACGQKITDFPKDVVMNSVNYQQDLSFSRPGWKSSCLVAMLPHHRTCPAYPEGHIAQDGEQRPIIILVQYNERRKGSRDRRESTPNGTS